MLAFWFRLLTGKQSKLSLLVYNLLLNDINNTAYNRKWIVKSILDDAGYTHIWISQCEGITSVSVFKHILMQGLQINIDLQSWYAYADNSSKASNYKIFRHTFALEIYMERKYWCPLTRFRLSNHNLPIETGRLKNVTIQNRICQLCNNFDIGDESHDIFTCTFSKMKEIVTNHLSAKPNIYRLLKLFNCKTNPVFLEGFQYFVV